MTQEQKDLYEILKAYCIAIGYVEYKYPDGYTCWAYPNSDLLVEAHHNRYILRR